MQLGLSKIMDRPGESIDFSVSVDLSDLLYGTSYPVSEPVLASGSVRNTAGVLVMTGTVKTCIHGVCDRCAADFTQNVELPINVVLVEELSNEDQLHVLRRTGHVFLLQQRRNGTGIVFWHSESRF